jgi:hypothetical protein
MVGSGRSGLVIALVLIFGIFSLHVAFPMRYFINKQQYWEPLVAVFLLLSSVSSLMATHLTDPGIIPPRPPPPSHWLQKRAKRAARRESYVLDLEEDEEQDEEQLKTATEQMLGTFYSRAKVVPSNNPQLSVAYCYTCHHWRTPRAVHCSDCGVDVDVFDHHCPWVGNCVGKRNYRYFFTFVWMTVLLGLFVAGMSVMHIVMVAKDIEKMPSASPAVSPNQARPNGSAVLLAFSKAPASLGIAIITIFIIFGVLSLGCYHASLMMSGLTTSEDIKGRYRLRNPFYQGSISKQILYSLCGPIYPSAFDKNHRHDYFADFEASSVNMKDYPYEDDGQASLSPNHHIDPFVPGSFSLKRTENHNPNHDSDDESESDSFARRPPSEDEPDTLPPRRNSQDEKESLLGDERV